jgi:ankyrin repeat protein
MDQVVRALKLVATSRSDTRRAASCIELAISYACDFVKEYDSPENTIDSSSVALEYILKAAELGDIWARVIAYRVSQALQIDILAKYPIRLWLFDAASQGSRIALESLEQLDISLHKEALTRYRSTFCGNPTQQFTSLDPTLKWDPRATINERGDTFLHWIASTGQVEEFESFIATQLANNVINQQNNQGDTPLLCATRAGHHEILMRLVGRNADASILNTAGENPLHFLGSLDEDQIAVAAQLLVTAGAAIDAEAKAYTGNTYLQTKPTGKGCPKLRAVMLDQPHVLKALLGLNAYQQSLDHRLR